MDDIRAISLTRPWPYTILHLGKRIENRSDKRGMPPMCRHRGPLLLHAALGWDDGVADWCFERQLADEIDAPRLNQRDIHPTGIVGRCDVVGHVAPLLPTEQGDDRPLIVMGAGLILTTVYTPDRLVHVCGPVEVTGALARIAAALDLRWWMGGFGLILDDVVAFDEPIPCRGALGLWRPPADVLAQLGERP